MAGITVVTEIDNEILLSRIYADRNTVVILSGVFCREGPTHLAVAGRIHRSFAIAQDDRELAIRERLWTLRKLEFSVVG